MRIDRFQSTPPAWGATEIEHNALAREIVSIHAPRVGGDGQWPVLQVVPIVSIHAPRVGGDEFFDMRRIEERSFNPRPPRGGRPKANVELGILSEFQSTPPAWGATVSRGIRGFACEVSIHAPRVGGDNVVHAVTP